MVSEEYYSNSKWRNTLNNWINSSCHLNEPSDLDKVLQEMIPLTPEFFFDPSPIMSDFVNDCPQEYFSVTTRRCPFVIVQTFINDQ
jgi:hypothetical protein